MAAGVANAPPYPSPAAHLDLEMRELYRRVVRAEAALGLDPGTVPDVVTPLLEFKVLPLVAVQYAEATISANTLWPWWEGQTEMAGTEPPRTILRLTPYRGDAPFARIFLEHTFVTGVDWGGRGSNQDIPSFDLRIGTSIAGLSYEDAFNASGNVAIGSAGMHNTQTRRTSVGLNVIRDSFAEPIEIKAAIWATWNRPGGLPPETWFHVPGELSFRMMYVHSPDPSRVTVDEFQNEVIYTRDPTIPGFPP